jgi:hypothetical protein
VINVLPKLEFLLLMLEVTGEVRGKFGLKIKNKPQCVIVEVPGQWEEANAEVGDGHVFEHNCRK